MATDMTEPDMTAAELALGVLDGAERAAALRRMLTDRAFAQDVAEWRERLAGLFEEYRAVAAPAMADGLLAGGGRPHGRLAWTVAALTTLAAAVALFFALRPAPPAPFLPAPPHAMMVAALAPTGRTGSPISTVIDLTTSEVRVAAAALAPDGRTAELWMIRDGVPHSLGLLRRDAPTRLVLDRQQRAAMGAGVVLAVSIEPPGGSPKPTPTGPVVATGALAAA